MEFFNKGVGFSYRACKDFKVRYTCVNSVIGPFMGNAGTTTPLVAYDKREITYLAATNARLLPYLGDEGLRYVHYSTHRVKRQFGLYQDVPNDFTLVLNTPTSIPPFCTYMPLSFGAKSLPWSPFPVPKGWVFALLLCTIIGIP